MSERKFETTFRIPGQKEPWVETFFSNYDVMKAAQGLPVGTRVRVWIDADRVGFELEVDRYGYLA